MVTGRLFFPLLYLYHKVRFGCFRCFVSLFVFTVLVRYCHWRSMPQPDLTNNLILKLNFQKRRWLIALGGTLLQNAFKIIFVLVFVIVALWLSNLTEIRGGTRWRELGFVWEISSGRLIVQSKSSKIIEPLKFFDFGPVVTFSFYWRHYSSSICWEFQALLAPATFCCFEAIRLVAINRHLELFAASGFINCYGTAGTPPPPTPTDPIKLAKQEYFLRRCTDLCTVHEVSFGSSHFYLGIAKGRDLFLFCCSLCLPVCCYLHC